MKNTEKVTRSVSERKLNLKSEFTYNVSFIEKTFKSEVHMQPGMTNLFGTDWIALFDLWEVPVNSFCNKINVEKIKKEKIISKFKKKKKKISIHKYNKGSTNVSKPTTTTSMRIVET